MNDQVEDFELDLGRSSDGGRAYAQVRLSKDGELGISFEHTPKGRKRHAAGSSYGQLPDLKFEPGSLGDKVQFIWRGYHLNNMHAGCEHQRAAGWENDREDGPYGSQLAHVGEPCLVCGYRFGTAWKSVPLPTDVVGMVQSWGERSP